MNIKEKFRIFLLILLSISVLLIMYSVINEEIESNIKLSSAENKTFEVVYENLTQEEINYSKELISELKEIYTLKLNKVIFTSSVESKIKGIESREKYCPTYECYGLCYVKEGIIYVNWHYKSKRIAKETLCHELLHLYLKAGESNSSEDYIHKIIYDLVSYDVCYKN